AGQAIFPPDEKVAEIFARSEGLCPKAAVYEGDCLAVGDAEPVIHPADYDSRCESRDWTTTAFVDGFVVGVLVGCMHHNGEIFAAAVAEVDVALLEETIKGGAVEFRTLRLRDDR